MYPLRFLLPAVILVGISACGGGSSDAAPVPSPGGSTSSFLVPSSTSTAPLTISRSQATIVQVNDVSGMTYPTTTNANCAGGSPASSGNPSYSAMGVYAASGAPTNCTATITVNMTDGKTGTEYVVVP